MTPEQMAAMIQAMQTYFLGQGMDPIYYGTGSSPDPYGSELDPYVQNVFSTGMAPNTNKEGEILPYNLDWQKSAMNYQQDVNTNLADTMNAYMASLFGGDLGGDAAFAAGVFDPVMEETPLELTANLKLQALRDTGGVQGTLADLMLGDPENNVKGMNAGQAAAYIRDVITNPGDYAEQGITQETADQLKAELGTTMEQGLEMPDWGNLQRQAQELYTPYLQDQALINQPGVTNRDGRYFTTKEVDSPQTEFLKKLGLPDPRARYDFQYALDNDPAIAGLFMQQGQTETQLANMRKTLDQYTKKLTKQREQESQARESDRQAMERYRQQAPFVNANTMVDTGRRQELGPTPQMPTSDPNFIPDLNFAGMGGGTELTGPLGPRERRLPQWEQLDRPQLSIWNNATGDEVNEAYNRLLDATNKIAGAMGAPSIAKRSRRVAPGGDKPMRMALNALQKKKSDTDVAMFRSVIPYLARNAFGYTPAKDAIQQRLLPAYASGAFGQQNHPSAYPSRQQVEASLFG